MLQLCKTIHTLGKPFLNSSMFFGNRSIGFEVNSFFHGFICCSHRIPSNPQLTVINYNRSKFRVLAKIFVGYKEVTEKSKEECFAFSQYGSLFSIVDILIFFNLPFCSDGITCKEVYF